MLTYAVPLLPAVKPALYGVFNVFSLHWTILLQLSPVLATATKSVIVTRSSKSLFILGRKGVQSVLMCRKLIKHVSHALVTIQKETPHKRGFLKRGG